MYTDGTPFDVNGRMNECLVSAIDKSVSLCHPGAEITADNN